MPSLFRRLWTVKKGFSNKGSDKQKFPWCSSYQPHKHKKARLFSIFFKAFPFMHRQSFEKGSRQRPVPFLTISAVYWAVFTIFLKLKNDFLWEVYWRMNRVYNFSAGPSMLPLEVLEKAQKEFVCYGQSGMSVMEMSHRSNDFEQILYHAENTLRELMDIPKNYKILFLQGGGSTQFAMIPMNLMGKNHKADYVKTGQWASKAIEEAQRYGQVHVVASSEDTLFDRIPPLDASQFDKEADYFYITLNNTIYGTRYTTLPQTGAVPLVGDMSSSILSEEIDITKFGLLYAGAQKNLGPAGVTLVIIREDLMGHAMDITPTMLRYDIHAKNHSLYNTPPTYGIYFMGLVFDWIKEQGGIKAMQKRNEQKANLLYDFLDQSRLFRGTVVKKNRSLMNIPFVLPTKELDAKFIAQAHSKGFVNLKGHRTVGGMRASIYNAMPLEGVKALVEWMEIFEKENQ